MKMRGFVAGVGLCAVAVGVAPGTAEAVSPRGTYVALGDSYTAAPLVPPAASKAPPICARSAGNYPNTVAKALELKLTDVSCSGARVDDFAESQGGQAPPQFAALRRDTDLVTVGIGGNDDGLFASVIGGCTAVSLKVLTGTLTPCKDTFGDRFAKSIAADAKNIRAALREIAKRSPKARVLVVGYPSLLPTDALGQAQCPLAGVPFTPGDIDYLDGVERLLNAMLKASAKATGAIFVDTYTQSIGRDMCRLPGIRWIEPVFPLAPAAPFHPNADGQAAVAEVVAAAAK
ncbi:MAG: SGNH/GDSL hydrolase family protein [Sporichthyaceae bacterium]